MRLLESWATRARQCVDVFIVVECQCGRKSGYSESTMGRACRFSVSCQDCKRTDYYVVEVGEALLRTPLGEREVD